MGALRLPESDGVPSGLPPGAGELKDLCVIPRSNDILGEEAEPPWAHLPWSHPYPVPGIGPDATTIQREALSLIS